ncbi:MAG: tRNA pseudouridine(55) synthase TruB [candidate division WOR-3 bacterium]
MTYTKSLIANSQEKNRLRGVLLINKPSGLSSYDCIRKIKPIIPRIKIGHAGTLDPIANGLLIILFGEATKIAQYLSSLDKEYIAKIHLGIVTDTDDITGKIVKESSCEHINAEDIKNAINSLKDITTQQPPKYSALKHKGKRMYDLARKGIDFTPKPRTIEIKKIDLLSFNLPYFEIKTTVSKGTYIRALARDLGNILGCGATLEELTRTQIGKFKLKDAISLIDINADLIRQKLYSINESLAEIPSIMISNSQIQKILKGQPLSISETLSQQMKNSLVRILDEKDRVLIIGKLKNNIIYPDRLIYADIQN